MVRLGASMRNSLVNWSLSEALVTAHLGELQRDAMLILSASLFIIACWFLF
jgi:hypothetical protein